MRQVQWIFFDLGDTVVDESQPFDDILNQFTQAARELGYRFTLDEAREELTLAYAAMHPQPMRIVSQKLIGSEAHRLLVRKATTYRKELEQPFPEAEAVLSELAGRYKLGVIANQSEGTVRRLRQYGLLRYFDEPAVCASAELGCAKPDRQIFDYALARAGCAPGEAAMVGDRIDNDIVPAKELGMRAVWIRQGFARRQPLPQAPLAPDVVIDRLGELLRHF